MLSKCSILEPSLADWTSVQFSFRLQLRSWTVKSWKLKKFFEIPSNWQLKNQVKSESVSCQKHQTKRAPTIFLRILIFLNVFRSKSTINCRHLCSLFPFLFASNKAKRQFGELYSKKLTTLKMCYIAIHNKGACSLNLTNLTTHKMSSIIIRNKGPAVVTSFEKVLITQTRFMIIL